MRNLLGWLRLGWLNIPLIPPLNIRKPLKTPEQIGGRGSLRFSPAPLLNRRLLRS